MSYDGTGVREIFFSWKGLHVCTVCLRAVAGASLRHQTALMGSSHHSLHVISKPINIDQCLLGPFANGWRIKNIQEVEFWWESSSKHTPTYSLHNTFTKFWLFKLKWPVSKYFLHLIWLKEISLAERAKTKHGFGFGMCGGHWRAVYHKNKAEMTLSGKEWASVGERGQYMFRNYRTRVRQTAIQRGGKILRTKPKPE